jgi:hypothetical protein
MHKLIALIYFILAIAGCDHAGRTIVMRSTADGVDLLYSRVTVLAATSTFECISSRSGQCHYSVFEHDCTSLPSCGAAPVRQFAIVAGSEQDVAGLPVEFQVCAEADAAATTSQCLHPAAAPRGAVATSD